MLFPDGIRRAFHLSTVPGTAMKNTLNALLSLALVTITANPETIVKGRRSLVLDGSAAQVVVDIAGGSIVSFQFQDQKLNPLVWGEKGEPAAPRPMGHFLCLDRWGAPSEAEKNNGMPFHGEAAQVVWKILSDSVKSDGAIHAEMAAVLPIAGLEVGRRITMREKEAVLTVSETVTNRNKLGRLYNMVQHPTIGSPFLDETTLVDSNARKGFMQSSPMPNPEEPAVYWPQAINESETVDLRRLRDDPIPNVVSFTIDEEYGWATASNAARGLLIGYIWKNDEYPWFNVWRHVENGRPLARGLEFGTTGLHQPYGTLLAKGRIFGRPIYGYLDANSTVKKSYAVFLFKIRQDYKGVAAVIYKDGKLRLRERGSSPEKDLAMVAGELF
jgi:Domain of unknown function (DUF4432)